MALTGISLIAASATGPGQTITFDVPKSLSGMQVTVTGSPSDARVDLEGTIDGVNFVRLASWELVSNGDGGIVWGTPTFASSAGAVVTALRANLTSITGGSNPTVTAVLAAA